MPPMRARRPTLAAACLGASLAVTLLAGCGGSGSTTGAGHGQETAKSRPAPPKSAFPAAAGRTLKEILKSADRSSELKIQPGAMVFYEGPNRYPFEVFEKSKGGRQGAEVDDAEVAIYYARVPPQAPKAKAGAEGPAHTVRGEALEQPAIGPFPAKIETLATKPRFESRSTAADPESADVVYSTEIPLPENGQWRLAALIKEGDELTATPPLPSANVGEFTQIPRPGQQAPLVHTPTAKDVGGDLSKITTRVPPDTLNKVDYAEALGKEPILLLFATPQFCQSRVCGPLVDEAQEAQAKFGNQAQFIHMEIYNDNDPGKFARPQVRAFHLPSEPWLFAIDREGTVTSAIEGAVGSELLDETVEKAVGG
jgi:hypothetical protein